MTDALDRESFCDALEFNAEGGDCRGPTKSERCGEIEMLAPESQMTGYRSVEVQ